MRDIVKKNGVTLDGIEFSGRLSEPKVQTLVNHDDIELVIGKGATFLELSLEEVKLIAPQLEMFIKIYST